MDAFEDPREQRFQLRLRSLFPIYEFIELTVDRLGNPLRCSVPMSKRNGNHFGVMHAGVLFSLAEATAGLAVTQHREFGKMVIIAQKVIVEFTRPARSKVTATVSLGDDFLDTLRKGLADDPKHKFEVPVDLNDERGELIMKGVCGFQLRASMENDAQRKTR